MRAAGRQAAAARQRTIRTREEWLSEVASAMSGWFDDLDFPLPPFQVRSGLPSSGRRGANTAETWTQEDGQSHVIIVRPDRKDAVEVAAAIAHQMCHIASGPRDDHGHLFRHLAVSIGLRGRRTESRPGAVFEELIRSVIEQVGELPTPEWELASSPTTAKQTARLIKVACRDCGYIARVSRKWLDSAGPPHCPKHGQMTPDD